MIVARWGEREWRAQGNQRERERERERGCVSEIESKKERERKTIYDVRLQCNYYENVRSFTKLGRSNLITNNQLLDLVRGSEVRVQRH